MPDPLLEVNDLAVTYGPVLALRGVSLRVNRGQIVALLGANGAGKSTMLRAISGVVRPASGTIHFAGHDLVHLSPERIVSSGIAHAPEGRHVFADLTVAENLDLGAYALGHRGALQDNLDRAYRYFPILAERRNQKAGTLSGGQQQMLAVARALMSSPRLLMLDEPSLGLAPKLVDQIFEIIREINRAEGMTILLVEQNANEALLHADYAYVLETGQAILEGPADQVRKDPRVIEAYLGG
jgi:branched-chain amino acid transport system ATP-binding protein